MSDFPDDVRDQLARHANRVQMTGDFADLESRIDRSQRRRDAARNGLALGGATVIVVVVVLLATIVTRSDTKLVTATTPTSTTAPSPPSTMPSGLANGEPAARATITSEYVKVFQPGLTDAQRVALIDRNAGLFGLIQAVRGEAPVGTLDTVRVKVDHIQFALPTLANVTYSIHSTDAVHFPGTRTLYGGAVFVDGQWQMTRATFCDTIQLLGVYCPENAPRATTTTIP